MMAATTGTSGKVSSQAHGFINNAGAGAMFDLLNTGSGTTGHITVNTQTAADIGIRVTFSVNDVGNTITMTHFLAEELT
jgi:hypothetical protein